MAARAAGALRAAAGAARSVAAAWTRGGGRQAAVETARAASAGAAASPRGRRGGAAVEPEAFRGAAAKVIANADWDKFNASDPSKPVGPAEDSYVAPLAPMVQAVAAAPPGDVLSHMEGVMGLDPGKLQGGAVFAALYGGAEQRKLPTGKEAGANAKFVAGGETSGGMPEAVQPGSSRKEHVYMPIDQEGLESVSAVRTMDLQHMATASRVARYLALAQARGVEEP